MLQKCDTVITLSHTDLYWEAFELELVCCLVYDTRSLLGICMRIRCLTWSTWKDRNSEPQSAGETMPCCPPPICSQVSERSKSLKWWRTSRFLSSLSCCLSSFCWAVNLPPYIWTRSGIVFYLPSPRPGFPRHRTIASWAARAKRYVNYA